MGNGIGKVCLCSAAAGEISRRHNTNLLGDSILYVRPPDPFSDDDVMTTFRSVSGASVSANSSTPPSTTVVSDSSGSFTSSMPLQQHHAWWSGPMDKGFSSGPVLNENEKGSSEPSKNLRRSFSHDENGFGNEPRKKNQNFNEILKRVISGFGFISKGVVWINEHKKKKKKNAVANATLCGGLSLPSHDADIDHGCYLDDGGDLVLMGLESENIQWAQGKAGEDRVHIVISEEQGWVFVGIYDGFNGPDATDYLLNNLFCAVYDELKGLLCGTHNSEPLELEEKVLGLVSDCCSSMENDVLLALSVALKKTEDAFLKSVDDNPVLAMMGSCVLVMLMKGEDVYLMNVGDSRAVLATHSAKSIQLTMEHNTLVKEVAHIWIHDEKSR